MRTAPRLLWLVTVAALAIAGCGRTGLETEPLPDGSLPDVVPIDDRPTDGPPVDRPDALPPGCRVDSDCAGMAGTPFCDAPSARCVECLPSVPGACRRGTFCDVASLVCAPGCSTDVDCNPMAPRCRVATHACVPCLGDPDCRADQACSDFRCASRCRGGAGCGRAEECCNAVCIDPSTNPQACGGCGNACPPAPNAVAGCAAEQCTIAACTPGFGDCDHIVDNGCEVDLRSSAANCGACGRACGAGLSCIDGGCVPALCGGVRCSAGQQCCNGATCADTSADPRNCGGCGVVCGPGASCVAGMCSSGSRCPDVPCAAGQTCCGGTCLGTQSDRSNCGACGVVCDPGEFCQGGACCQRQPDGSVTCSGMVCPTGQTNCAGTCLRTDNDPNNCGACFVRCAAGSACVASRCVPTTGCGGGHSCPPGLNCCGASCTNEQTDPTNCGACGALCATPPHAAPVCASGACDFRCLPGFADCDENPATGCESNSATDPRNCGACGVACAAGTPCIAGMCAMAGCNGGPACAPGTLCCADGCRAVAGDPRNCGACGNACPAAPNAAPTCASGECGIICRPGFGNCDGNAANGCEAFLGADANNCGACGNACGAGRTCVLGVCRATGCGLGPPCGPGTTCCSGSCLNTSADVANCGGCGLRCAPPHATPLCAAGACGIAACEPGFADCNGRAADGCEANLATDPANCGRCGGACGAGLACAMGRCAPPSDGSEGAFLPVANPTVLSPGVHNFTTITVPAGSVVLVAGTGPASGTLDLRATGHVQIDGTIDVSGGAGTQAVIASRSTQQGRAGSGGYTGEQRAAAMPVTVCEFIAGAPGLNGPMTAGTAGTCRVASTTVCTSRTDPESFVFAAPPATFGGGGGVFTGFRAYGGGGGGPAGGAPGALGAPFAGERDCTGVTGGGGASAGRGGDAMSASYNGAPGTLGQTQCPGIAPGVDRAWVGGGGGGSIGAAAATDLPADSTFTPGSGGGGGSADYLQRPAFGGTSGGGGAGGALRLWTTADIVVNGQLLANGGRGGDANIGTPAGAMCDPQPGAAGGGGSGGLLFLRAPVVSVGPRAALLAHGGAGGDASVFANGGAGGAGGTGRIRISANPAACMLAGTFDPPLVASCAPSGPVPGRAYVGAYPN